MKQPVVFGVRHLSPAGAWHLIKLLDRVHPQLVLVEGPSDLTDQMKHIANSKAKPPIAIMAYTNRLPIQTILYPFAVYSPEYQAIIWAHRHKCPCRFIDLPSGAFLAISESRPEPEEDAPSASTDVYDRLDRLSEEDGHEGFWERTMEHSLCEDAYYRGAREFGSQLRALTERGDDSYDYARNITREAYMRRRIQDAVAEGYDPEKIVVVTGAYHVKGLLSDVPAMTDAEIESLPSTQVQSTLMPYSYFRLSSRSGYGAGNKAPAYYELLWRGLKSGSLTHTAYNYLSHIAAFQRRYGNCVSTAEVIEAVRLAAVLAQLHGYNTPSLRDLRDAAVTCMGHGHFSEISMAVADTEIGTKIGSLPEGISRTSIQEDFYRLLDELNLEAYKTSVAKDLSLDLREKLTAKTEKAAFMDLRRSFFLHRLRVLGIQFAKSQAVVQADATWAEKWTLRWTTEAEIEIVEAVLKGDTVEQAASFMMKECVEKSDSLTQTAGVIENAFFCGMPESVRYATAALQRLTADAAAVPEIAGTAHSLSIVIRYGSIRQLDSEPLVPILRQLFLRACLLLCDSCICDSSAVEQIIAAMEQLNEVSVHHDFLDTEKWLRVLGEISARDDLNTKASGYATAVLLERGRIDDEKLGIEVQRRLSRGVPADLGACWFEGLSMKNHYALIARMSLWKQLSDYIETLGDEDFKRALVFLRRAFTDFSANEKDSIAENLGELWGVNPTKISEMVNRELDEADMEQLGELDDFDFSDI